MKPPFATIALSLAIIASYALLSKGTFYIPDSELSTLAFQLYKNPLSILSHMFIHVGILHVVGNLVPLLLFGWLAETVLLSKDVLLIFLSAGVFSSAVFSLFETKSLLVGASAAIAGLMGAAALLKPKQAIFFLLLAPLLVGFVVFPLFSTVSTSHVESLVSEKKELEQQARVLVQQNRTEEAAQVNQTISQVQEKISISQEGMEREQTAEASALVHFFGSATGVAYLYFFKKKEFRKGLRELASLGASILLFFRRIRQK